MRATPIRLLIPFIAAIAVPVTGAVEPMPTPISNGAASMNPAPAFSGGKAEGSSITLQSLRGKPVVLLITPSPRNHAFLSQLAEFRGRFERLAAKGMIGFVAFTGESGRIRSNIPFLTVDHPTETAYLYDVSKGFAIAVIGVDGNLDCLSTKPLPGQRVLDLINNNASVQEQLRR